jgi:hypothetical protein
VPACYMLLMLFAVSESSRASSETPKISVSLLMIDENGPATATPLVHTGCTCNGKALATDRLCAGGQKLLGEEK